MKVSVYELVEGCEGHSIASLVARDIVSPMCPLTNLSQPLLTYLLPTGKPFVFGYDYTHFFYALSPVPPYVESN